MFYYFITKYTAIFCWKNERSKSFSHFFNQKYWQIWGINVRNLNETLTDEVVSFDNWPQYARKAKIILWSYVPCKKWRPNHEDVAMSIKSSNQQCSHNITQLFSLTPIIIIRLFCLTPVARVWTGWPCGLQRCPWPKSWVFGPHTQLLQGAQHRKGGEWVFFWSDDIYS